MGEAVAKTIGQGQVDTHAVTMTTILAALLGAIIWGLLTWWFGIPSSSSHALIGGLCGAALATSHGNWAVLIWDRVTIKGADGLWPKVIKPMIISPVFGFALGFRLDGPHHRPGCQLAAAHRERRFRKTANPQRRVDGP